MSQPASTSTLHIKTPAVFAPLCKPARFKGAYGGRGSAKSHFFATRLLRMAMTHRDRKFRAVCVREVQKSLKESVKLLVETKMQQLGIADQFTPRTDHTQTPGGVAILYQGMQDHNAENIKSLEACLIAYVEEAQTLTERSLEVLRPTIRLPGSELWFSWNPRHHTDPIDQFLRGDKVPHNAVVVRTNWRDNPFFPDVLEEERLHDLYANPLRYAHIWDGEYEPAVVGALWDMATINQHRRAEPPDNLERIVVSVDPAGSAGPLADEHGIIVAGIGPDKRAYILKDATCKGPPKAWSNRAVSMYRLYGADVVVIERNYGGDMARHTLRTVDPMLPIQEVHASRGKHVRAEPISALYSMGRVSHVGAMPELEAQMCQMTTEEYEGPGSPDRLDALVWAMTELYPELTTPADKPRLPWMPPVEPTYDTYYREAMP